MYFVNQWNVAINQFGVTNKLKLILQFDITIDSTIWCYLIKMMIATGKQMIRYALTHTRYLKNCVKKETLRDIPRIFFKINKVYINKIYIL